MKQIELTFQNIQKRMDSFISDDLMRLIDSIRPKIDYLDKEQWEEFQKNEIIKVTDEISSLMHKYNKILKTIQPTFNIKNFLWNSSFYEVLNVEEKYLYIGFDALTLEYSKYLEQRDCYDNALPYFSQIVRYVVLNKYASELQSINSLYHLFKTNKSVVSVTEPADTNEKTKPSKTLESKLENWQIDILVKCLVETNIFEKTMTDELISKIFSCTLERPLKLNPRKGKLLVYFLWRLEGKYISTEWQAACSRAQLFISAEGTILDQNNLSSSVGHIKEVPPKDCETIDKYIKQLKKD